MGWRGIAVNEFGRIGLEHSQSKGMDLALPPVTPIIRDAGHHQPSPTTGEAQEWAVRGCKCPREWWKRAGKLMAKNSVDCGGFGQGSPLASSCLKRLFFDTIVKWKH
ncbi:hypothetical protein MAP00_003830 [Monascus purpureus]|nr:hypothetical protein MAP00_003830 [Monascus purpureus]